MITATERHSYKGPDISWYKHKFCRGVGLAPVPPASEPLPLKNIDKGSNDRTVISFAHTLSTLP